MGRRQHHAQRIHGAGCWPRCGEHHGHGPTRAHRQQFCVTRKVVPAGEQCVLVERRGDETIDDGILRQGDRAVHGEAGEPARIGGRLAGGPLPDHLVDHEASATRPHQQQVGCRHHTAIAERGSDDFRPDAARIAERDREADARQHQTLRITAPPPALPVAAR